VSRSVPAVDVGSCCCLNEEIFILLLLSKKFQNAKSQAPHPSPNFFFVPQILEVVVVEVMKI
jgi:hypothetical protein